MTEYSVIGKPLPRVDGLKKLSGQAKYTVDIVLPDMLYAKILRSPHPHARILSIDTSKGRGASRRSGRDYREGYAGDSVWLCGHAELPGGRASDG